MPNFVRLLHVLRKGPRQRRFQAWIGLVLVMGAGLWLVWEYILPMVWAIAVALLGLFLIRRSLRESRPSS